MTPSIYLLTAALLTAQVPSPGAPLTPADAPPAASPSLRLQLIKRADTSFIVGISTLSLGGIFWGLMLGGLIRGARDARSVNAIIATANQDPRPLTALEQQQVDLYRLTGRRNNLYAVAGGVTAGVLTVIGVVFLGRVPALRRRTADISPLAVPRGFGLGWRLQF
jgi:hypothetical protein